MEMATLQVAGITPSLIGVVLPFTEGKSIQEVIDNYSANMMKELNEYNGVIDALFQNNVSPKALQLMGVQEDSENSRKTDVLNGIIAYFIIKAPNFFWEQIAEYDKGSTLGSQTIGDYAYWVNDNSLTESPKALAEELPANETIKIKKYDYNTLRKIIKDKSFDGLEEWQQFVNSLKQLPFATELLFN